MKIVKPPLDSFNQDQGQPIYIDFNLNANQTSGLRWKTTDPNDSEDTTLDVGFYLDDDDDHLQIFDYRNGRALQEWYTNQNLSKWGLLFSRWAHRMFAPFRRLRHHSSRTMMEAVGIQKGLPSMIQTAIGDPSLMEV